MGASNLPAWVVSRANTLAQWRDWTPFAGVQVPYNPLSRDIERELLPMSEALGLSVATYAGLAGGVLSGKYTRPGGAPTGSRIDPASLTERDHRAARTVDQIAQELGATPSQAAIAWALARSHAVHPIVGARDTAQLADNLDAVQVSLPPQALERLDALAGFDPGYPTSDITASRPWISGQAQPHLEGHPHLR